MSQTAARHTAGALPAAELVTEITAISPAAGWWTLAADSPVEAAGPAWMADPLGGMRPMTLGIPSVAALLPLAWLPVSVDEVPIHSVTDATAAVTGTPRIVLTGRPRHQRVRRYRPVTWRNAPIVTWYGPGFYGNGTACGVRYTRYIVGVAHRTLPCGTLVRIRWHGIVATAPVIDRGPFSGPQYVFDLSAAMSCRVLKPRGIHNSCFTRYDVKWRVVGKVKLSTWLARHRRWRDR